jgi:6-phosphogluconolactonase (cycloisomerase 2 family)
VSFTPNGRKLVVTIKDGPVEDAIPGVIPTGPGRVLVFDVKRDGRPSEDFTQTDFENRGPFGFSFDRQGNLLVALFIGGENLTGAAGSFRINRDGTLTPITPVVEANGEIDLCWLENNGRYAYGANYTTGVISSFNIDQGGGLTLLEGAAGLTDPTDVSQGPTPLDLGISRNGRFLYNVLPGSGKVAAWEINVDGSLTKIGEFPGLGQTVDGDMAPFDFSPLESPAGIAVF